MFFDLTEIGGLVFFCSISFFIVVGTIVGAIWLLSYLWSLFHE